MSLAVTALPALSDDVAFDVIGVPAAEGPVVLGDLSAAADMDPGADVTGAPTGLERFIEVGARGLMPTVHTRRWRTRCCQHSTLRPV